MTPQPSTPNEDDINEGSPQNIYDPWQEFASDDEQETTRDKSIIREQPNITHDVVNKMDPQTFEEYYGKFKESVDIEPADYEKFEEHEHIKEDVRPEYPDITDIEIDDDDDEKAINMMWSIGGYNRDRAEFMIDVIKRNIEEREPDRDIYDIKAIFEEMTFDVSNDILTDLNESYKKALTKAIKITKPKPEHIKDVKPKYEPIKKNEIDEEMSILDLMLNGNFAHERAKFMAEVIRNYIDENEPNRDIYNVSIIYDTMIKIIGNTPLIDFDEAYIKAKQEAKK